MSQSGFDILIGFLTVTVVLPAAWVGLWAIVVAVEKWRDKP